MKSYRANGEGADPQRPVIRLATGERVTGVFPEGTNPSIVSTNFEHCGATIVRAELADGSVVLMVGHVSAQDAHGHKMRAQQDVDALNQQFRDRGIRNVEVVVIPGESENHTPARGYDAAPDTFPDGATQIQRKSLDEHANIVVTKDGIALHTGKNAAEGTQQPLEPHVFHGAGGARRPGGDTMQAEALPAGQRETQPTAEPVDPRARPAKIVGDDHKGLLGENQMRQSDAALVQGALEELAGTATGRRALRRIEDGGVKLCVSPGGGTYYDDATGTIYLDPKGCRDLAAIIPHEAHHAATMREETGATLTSPSGFVDERMTNEAHAETERIRHMRERGGPEVEAAWRAEIKERVGLQEQQLRAQIRGLTDEEYRQKAEQLALENPGTPSHLVYQMAYDNTVTKMGGTPGDDSDLSMRKFAETRGTEALEKSWADRRPSTQTGPGGLNYGENTVEKWIIANGREGGVQEIQKWVGIDPMLDAWIAKHPDRARALGIIP